MWSYIIDGLLILILVICTIVGIVKGLFDSLLSLIGTGLALVISVFVGKYVANFINKIFDFEELILKKLDGASEEGVISIFGTPLQNSDVAKFCVWICSVVIVFLIIKLVIYILAKIFESVTKSSPTLSGINRVLGMVFGLCKGAVIVVALLALCSLLSQVPIIGTPIYNNITKTKITNGVFKFVDDFVEKNLTEDKIKDIVEKIVSETSSADNSNKEDTKDDTSSDTSENTSGTTTPGTSVAQTNAVIDFENQKLIIYA